MPGPRDNQDGWGALGECRWIWTVVLLLEIANAWDWATSIVGVGMLGLPEQTPLARWLMAVLGVIPGLTVQKAGVGLLAAALGWIITWACRKKIGRAIHVIGLLWVLLIATALMVQTVMWNIVAIVVTLAGHTR